MENISNDFAESITAVAAFETMESDFYFYATNSPDPEDEEDDDSSESSNEDPALDEDVVHSPVPTKSGGKPRQ